MEESTGGFADEKCRSRGNPAARAVSEPSVASASATSASRAPSGIDPELEALPEPRRPWRRATLLTMATTVIAALAVAWSLRSLVTYASRTGPPREIGDLTHVQLGPDLANTWVHTVGVLAGRGVEFRRPLDSDRFRLVQAEQNPKLWIELRVPSDLEADRYVPPNSFVGRLVPLGEAGLRYDAVADAVKAALGDRPASDAWLLVDGEAPATTRWAIGLAALFVAFATFNVWGLVRILKPAE